MSETGREIPAGLNEFHVVRLFKCAVRYYDTLVECHRRKTLWHHERL